MCCVITTYSSDPMQQGFSWEPNSSLARSEIPHILWNLRLISMLTKACHLSLSWAKLIQSTFSHLFFTSVLILHFCLHLCLSSDFFLQVFQQNLERIFFSPYLPPVPPFHPNSCYHPNKILWEMQIMKLLITQFSPTKGDSNLFTW